MTHILTILLNTVIFCFNMLYGTLGELYLSYSHG